MGHIVIMGDQDQIGPGLVQFPQDLHDFQAGFGIQGPGRFIRQDQRRIAGQGPGDGYPLLLPAGQLRRFMMDPVAQAYFFQGVDYPVPAVLLALCRDRPGAAPHFQKRQVWESD